MKVLILSCNTGGGHNSVAKAIAECFEEHGVYCEIADALSFVSPRVSEIVSKSHSYVYTHMPDLFRRNYEMAEKKEESMSERSLVFRALAKGAEDLAVCIEAGKFDTVICSHVFAGMMLTAAKYKYGLQVKSAIVETDYTNSPGAESNDLDLHFLPDEGLFAEAVSRGIPEKSLVASGIPVRKSFFDNIDMSEAKAALGLPPDEKHFVMMSGSMGCGPMEELSDLLIAELPPKVNLTVLCGTNTELYDKLKEKYRDYPFVRVGEIAEKVSLLYDSADLLITKPGGISTSEAGVKGTPMVLIDTVGGCESYNLCYYLRKGQAATATTTEGLCAVICGLAENPGLLSAMRRSPQKEADSAAQCIYRHIAAL